jgi:GTP-binding protein HflX
MGTVNATLQEIGAFDKPTLTIFNKMDLYEERTFDEWLDAEVKTDLLNQLGTSMGRGNRRHGNLRFRH